MEDNQYCNRVRDYDAWRILQGSADLITERKTQKTGDVCSLTDDVPGLAVFYNQLPGVDNDSNDGNHPVGLI